MEKALLRQNGKTIEIEVIGNPLLYNGRWVAVIRLPGGREIEVSPERVVCDYRHLAPTG